MIVLGSEGMTNHCIHLPHLNSVCVPLILLCNFLFISDYLSYLFFLQSLRSLLFFYFFYLSFFYYFLLALFSINLSSSSPHYSTFTPLLVRRFLRLLLLHLSLYQSLALSSLSLSLSLISRSLPHSTPL